MAAHDTGKMILFVRSILWDLGIPQEALSCTKIMAHAQLWAKCTQTHPGNGTHGYQIISTLWLGWAGSNASRPHWYKSEYGRSIHKKPPACYLSSTCWLHLRPYPSIILPCTFLFGWDINWCCYRNWQVCSSNLHSANDSCSCSCTGLCPVTWRLCGKPSLLLYGMINTVHLSLNGFWGGVCRYKDENCYAMTFGGYLLCVVKKSARSYSTYLRLTFWLKGRSLWKIPFASASQEFCAPGGLYFGYSVFLSVMLACWRCTPKSLFQTCNSSH